MNKDGRSVLLVMVGHLDWSQAGERLLMLQNKLNAYFAYQERRTGAANATGYEPAGDHSNLRQVSPEQASHQAFEMAGAEFAKNGISVKFELSDD
jgi:hypothetical protein